MIKENPNLYYTTPVYHMPIDDTGSAVEYIEAERTVVPDTAQHLIGQVVVEPIPNEYVNVLDATAEENSQVADGYIAYGKNGVRLVGTMTPSGSAIDFSDLDYTDEAIPGYYISAVNETDGIISVVREPLPEIPAAVSDLDNDVGYITAEDVPEIAGVPTNISDLRDDVGMMTIQDVRTYVFGGSISSTKAAAGDRLEVISITSFTTSSYQDLAEHCYSKPVHFIVEIDDDINVDFNDNLPASWNNAIFMHIDRVYLEGADEDLPIDATNWTFEVHRDYDGIIWRGTLTLYQGHLQGVLNSELPAPKITYIDVYDEEINNETAYIALIDWTTVDTMHDLPILRYDSTLFYLDSYDTYYFTNPTRISNHVLAILDTEHVYADFIYAIVGHPDENDDSILVLEPVWHRSNSSAIV